MYERDELDFSNIIEESLEEIQSGRSSLEDVLKQHPDLAPQLRSELEIATWLSASGPEVAPRPSFIRASRKRIVERVRQESTAYGKKRGFFGLTFGAFNWQPVSAVVLAALLIFSISGLINAAHNTLPGESLYAVKRIHEQVQFGVTFSESARVVLAAEFSEHRLDEIRALLEQGKPAAAAELFDDFQLEVTRTVNLLNEVDESQPEVKIEAAQAVQVELGKQAQQLEDIQADAPPEVLAGLLQAHTVAMQGALIAVEVEDAVIQSTATPVPTMAVPSSTATSEPTKTATPVRPTNTSEPEATPGATQVPPASTEPAVVPGISTPTKEPKVTNTPRPTNENRPTQKPPKEEQPTEKPPKEEQPPPDSGKPDNSGPPEDQPGPPNNPKPTKEKKP